jgi:hypothetical protein
VVVAASQASAGDHSWGFDLSGGLSTYALDAVNDSLASLNQSLGTAFGSIEDGTSFGAAVRCWASQDVLLRLSLERNSAVTTDADRRFDIGAIDLTLGATYYLHVSGPIRLGGGLAAGATWIEGKIEGSQFSLEARGTGPDLRATAEALWPIAHGWFLSGSAGLRYATVGEVKLDGQGSRMRADFSGAVARIAAGYDGPPPPGQR